MGKKVQIKLWFRKGYVQKKDLSRWTKQEDIAKIVRLARLTELVVVDDWEGVKNTSWCWVVI